MRKELILILGLMFIVLVAGCGKKEVVGQTDYCNKVEDKESCFKEQAEITLNLDFCKRINDNDLRALCNIETIGKRLAGLNCEDFETESERDDCNKLIGSFRRDEETCDKIISLTKRDQCYLATANNYVTIKICDKIETEFAKEECVGYFKE